MHVHVTGKDFTGHHTSQDTTLPEKTLRTGSYPNTFPRMD